MAPQMSASQSVASTSPVEGSEIQYRFEFHRKIKHLLESNSVLRRKVLHAQEDVLRVKIGRLYGLRDFDIELKLPGLGIRFFGNMRRKGDLVTYDFTRCQFNHLRQK